MSQLGILPLLPLFAAGAGAVAAGFGLYKAKQVSDYEAWKKTVPAPKSAPPPAAPRTQEEMRTWSPDQQRQADTTAWEAWRKTALDQYKVTGQDDDLLVVAASAAVLAGLYLAFGGRR